MRSWAFAFPGQGSQRKGMFSAEGVPAHVVSAAREASDALGEDLVAASEGDSIDDTRNSQPALLAAGVGTYRAWLDAGGERPVVMSGHSLGEYAALVAAGAIGFADAVRLVRRRAEAMLEAVPSGKGKMCAVLGLDAKVVDEACEKAGEGVWAANYNAAGQVVLSGLAEAVSAAAEACKLAGAKRVVTLPVEVPSHCPLMEPAAVALASELDKVDVVEGNVPVLHNATGKSSEGPDETRRSLVDQLTKPVDWIACATEMGERADAVAECGPSGVLHGLNRRILGADRCHALKDQDAIESLCS